jgi:hypothetical protein
MKSSYLRLETICAGIYKFDLHVVTYEGEDTKASFAQLNDLF